MGCFFCRGKDVKSFDVGPLEIACGAALPPDVNAFVEQTRPNWTYAEPVFVCAACLPLVERRDLLALIERVTAGLARRGTPNARLLMFPAGVFPLLLFAALDQAKVVRIPEDAPAPLKTAYRAFAQASLSMLATTLGNNFPVRMFANGVGVHAELIPDALKLVTIFSTKPGQGEASRTLDAILRCADEDGTNVVLCAYPIPRSDGRSALSKEQLVAWYERHGFARFDAPAVVRADVPYDGEWMLRSDKEPPKLPGWRQRIPFFRPKR